MNFENRFRLREVQESAKVKGINPKKTDAAMEILDSDNPHSALIRLNNYESYRSKMLTCPQILRICRVYQTDPNTLCGWNPDDDMSE